MLVADNTGQVVSSNLVAQRLLGLSAEQLLSHYCQSVPSASDQENEGDALAVSVGSPLRLFTLAGGEGDGVVVKGTAVNLDTTFVGRPLTLILLDQQFTPARGIVSLTNDSLASISHEVRTPLCAITGYLDLLLDQHRTIRRSELRKILRTLRRSARWLEHSVDNMVAGLNIFAGRFQIAPRPIRLAELIEEAVAMVDVLAAGKQQNLVLILPEGKGAVWADRQHVLQVIANLLAHAIKQAPRGGRVTVNALPSASHWQISVSDNSPGAPWWQQHQLEGDPGDAPDAANAPASRMLGVAIARYVVELHGGSMGLSSSPDKGNTFWFTLPSAPAGITDRPALEPPTVSP